LMAVFSSLLTLRLGASETFSSISNRVDLMISRLRGWVPPIVLPGQLTLCCLLTALPESPYGPIRHIILARPNITYEDGTRMLRDVAQSAASFSAPRTPTSSAVMAAAATPAIFTQSDVAAMVATAIAAARAKDKKKRRGTDLFMAPARTTARTRSTPRWNATTLHCLNAGPHRTPLPTTHPCLSLTSPLVTAPPWGRQVRLPALSRLTRLLHRPPRPHPPVPLARMRPTAAT
jgi:hypothetical protein